MKSPSLFTVVYQDDALVVLNKAPGLLVAADRWDPDAPRLDNAAAEALCGQGERLFAVHRIDKDTSGLVIYARTEEAHRALSLAFQERQVQKTYHALVNGRPDWEETETDIPLRADGDLKHRTVADKRDGKPSVTRFRWIGPCGSYGWVEARPLTGRTHQIRVHLLKLGLPIVCDPLYGQADALYLSKIKRSWRGDAYEERPLLDRLGLHAWKLELAHPVTGEMMEWTAPYPRDLDTTRKQLAKIFKTDPLNEAETG